MFVFLCVLGSFKFFYLFVLGNFWGGGGGGTFLGSDPATLPIAHTACSTKPALPEAISATKASIPPLSTTASGHNSL
eukprot:109635-Amphidinium_carterae.1